MDPALLSEIAALSTAPAEHVGRTAHSISSCARRAVKSETDVEPTLDQVLGPR